MTICLPNPALGIDGSVARAIGPRDGCCPPSICSIDLCGLMCNYVNLLPRGPLWDKPKALAMDWAKACCAAGTLDEGECLPPKGCTSLAAYALYTARRLFVVLQEALWPALREASPYTAFTTLDDWLVRLGWQDCFAAGCRDPYLGALTPVEIPGPCKPVYVDLDYGDDLTCAVKRGIVIALWRLNLGIIRNLDAINFVIAELGAVLSPARVSCKEDLPCPCETADCAGGVMSSCPEPDEENPGDPSETVDPCCLPCRHVVLTIAPSRGWLVKCTPRTCDPVSLCDRGVCPPAEGCETVEARYARGDGDPEDLPDFIWPGVLAAECIVRSLLPPGTRILIERSFPDDPD